MELVNVEGGDEFQHLAHEHFGVVSEGFLLLVPFPGVGVLANEGVEGAVAVAGGADERGAFIFAQRGDEEAIAVDGASERDACLCECLCCVFVVHAAPFVAVDDVKVTHPALHCQGEAI